MSISLSLFAGVGAQLFTDSGSPLSGGLVYTYLAGTSTPVTSYTSVSGITANSNPIVLNAAGRTPAEVWLTDSVGVKFVVKTATGTTIGTYDNVFSTDSGSTDVLSLLAASSGSSLVGFLQAGTGAVARTIQSKNRDVVSPEDFGAVGDGVTNDTVALQAAITALDSGQTLHLENDYVVKGSGLTITNKTRITIEGPGRLKLVGADVDAVVLRLVGTCDAVTIDGVSVLGESLAGTVARQYGIYNNSGQAISNTTVRNCKLFGLQAGIAFNADSGGTYRNGICVNNYVDTMVGQVGGQGYGIFCANVEGMLIQGNQITNCHRHSIYAARAQTSTTIEHGVLITGNIIRNHRASVPTTDVRPAIFARGYGLTISNNQITNYFDGAIGVQVGLDEAAPAGNMRILGNQLSGRGNIVQSMNIGERLDPTTYRIKNVEISGNSIRSDMLVCGNGVEIILSNGQDLLVHGNHLHMDNILNVAYRPISVGQFSTQGAIDIDNVNIINNFYTGTLDASAIGVFPIRAVYFFTSVATVPAGGAARCRVEGNQVDPILLNVMAEYAATKTNKKLVVRDQWGGIPGVYTAGDTAPSVYGGVTYLVVINTVAVSIPTISDPVLEQVITLVFGDANTTIKHATGNIRLVGGVDFVSSSRDTLTLIYSPVYAQWLEVSRAVVS